MRQRELDDIAARLAKFKPTRIAIEALSDRLDYSSQKYTEFTAEKLSTNPDERVQIAPPRPTPPPQDGLWHR